MAILKNHRPATPQTYRNSSTIADNEREEEQIYSNDRRGDSRYTSQWQDSISSQQELDENGHPFVISSNGTTTFGEITENSGLQPAPIKLSEGENTTDTRGENHGYGLVHIEAGHGKQIRNAGFASIEEFVESVAHNYDTIREGGVIANNQTYLLEISDEHNNTLFIQLSKDGSYWNVNSAGISRKKYSRRKPEVFTRPALESENSTDFGVVNSGQSNGATTPAGNSPSTSTHKDISSSSQSQEINEEITPEQSSLLGRPNFAQYPTEQELYTHKVISSSSQSQEINKQVAHASPEQTTEATPQATEADIRYILSQSYSNLTSCSIPNTYVWNIGNNKVDLQKINQSINGYKNQSPYRRKIHQPISQGEHREEDAKTALSQAATRLRERIASDGRTTQGCVSRTLQQVENDITREYAQENNLWILFFDTFNLGIPSKSRNEHETYLNAEKGIIFKISNRITKSI